MHTTRLFAVSAGNPAPQMPPPHFPEPSGNSPLRPERNGRAMTAIMPISPGGPARTLEPAP